MKAALLIVALLCSGLALADEQQAQDGCSRSVARGMPEGPVSLGFGEADIGVGRRTCPRTEVVLGGRAGAVIDTPDFYGAIGASGVVSASHALSPTLELFATWDVPRFQWVTNAVIVGSELTLGQLSVGATRSFTLANAAGGVSARLLLPTSFAAPRVRVVGAEVGHGLRYRAHRQVELHGFVAVDVSAGISPGPAFPRVGAVVTAGAQYNPWRNVGLVLDLAGRYGWTSSLAPAFAVRVGAAGGFGAEVAVSRPILGTDRTTALLGVRLGYRL
jgi:hypothetical protein